MENRLRSRENGISLAETPPFTPGWDGGLGMEPASAGQHGSLIPVDFRAARSRQPAKPTVVLCLTIVGGWLVLAIEGEVDILVGWLVPDLVRRGTSLLVFDLHGVTFMDARG